MERGTSPEVTFPGFVEHIGWGESEQRSHMDPGFYQVDVIRVNDRVRVESWDLSSGVGALGTE